MTHTLTPAGIPGPRAYGHEGYDVHVAGVLTGTVARTRSGAWYVYHAGPGIKTPVGTYPAGRGAVIALLRARRDQAGQRRPGPDGLTGFERDMLGFEAAHPGLDRTRYTQVHEAFNISPAEYYGALAALLADPARRPAAFRHDPATAARLWRRLTQRSAQRAAWVRGDHAA